MKKRNFNFINVCKICQKTFKAQKQKDYSCSHECSKKAYYEKHKIYRKQNPWYDCFSRIKRRCNHPDAIGYKDYGGRGIKCLITIEEIKSIWFRDKAYLLKKASIDRINPDGDYIYSNCRFIENFENNSRAHKGKTHLVLNFPKMKKLFNEGKLAI